MIKKIAVTILIFIIIVAIALFIYRYQIVQYSAEAIIRNNLPNYATVDKIRFDFKGSSVALEGFKILNPPDFSNRYFVEIGRMRCAYKLKGRMSLERLEISDPVFEAPIINIERLSDGRVNLVEMQKMMERGQSKKKAAGEGPAAGKAGGRAGKLIGNKTIPDMFKLPEKTLMKYGRVVIIDRFEQARPNMITFDNIDAELSIKLNELYTKVIGIASTGKGNINNDKKEIIQWTISLDPNAPKLTMSNRLDISGADILAFRPYYDKYSPFIFKKGTFSGTLVFDFDNGNIGSTNEIRLSNLSFSVKPGYENAPFWETNVPDLMKYFTSPFGEVVFDFKIKGDMQNPKFYLGPKSKEALAAMAVDKISAAIEKASSKDAGPGGTNGQIDKAKEYIELFKGLLKKK